MRLIQEIEEKTKTTFTTSVLKVVNWVVFLLITKNPTNLVYNAFSKLFFVLANLKYINGYNMIKENWCHYITLALISSHLVKLTYHFQIYKQEVTATENF